MLIQHPDSVTIVAVHGDEIVAVRQTRRGAGGTTLELPAGCIEPGETPEQAAARELAEECGLAAASWRELGSFWIAPSYSTEFVHVFEAASLSPADGHLQDDDEDVVVEHVPLARAVELLTDAGSLAALALLRTTSGPG